MSEYTVISTRKAGRAIIVYIRAICPDCGATFETTKNALGKCPRCQECRHKRKLEYLRLRNESRRKQSQMPKSFVAMTEFRDAWYPSRESWEDYEARLGLTWVDEFIKREFLSDE